MSAWVRLAMVFLGLGLLGAAGDSPAQQAYQQANALFIARKFPEALAATENALRLDPRLVPALTLKAKLALAGGRHDLARQCLEQALAIDPRAAYAQFLYGMVAYLSNDLQAALPRFRKAHQLSPDDPRAALYLGLTVESLGDPAQAMSLYQEAVRLERSTGEVPADILLPGAKLLLLLDHLDESERWIREALKASPKSRDAHFELARVLLQKGAAEQAAAQGEMALTMSDGVTTDEAIHYLLIRAWQQSGRPDRAAMHAGIIRAQETPAKGGAKP